MTYQVFAGISTTVSHNNDVLLKGQFKRLEVLRTEVLLTSLKPGFHSRKGC